MFRSRKLLDKIHDLPCMASFAHQCTQYQGVEPAHSDSQIHGRGVSFKSADWAVAAMCHEAHMMLDTFSRELKQAEWMRAHVRTMDWLFENELVRVA